LVLAAGGVSVRRVTVPGNEKSRNCSGPIVPGAGPFRNHHSPTNLHRLHDPEYLPGYLARPAPNER